MFFMVSLIQLLVFKNLKFGLKKNTWYNFYVYGNSILITLPLNLCYIFFVGDDYLTIVLIIGIISFLLGLIYQIWAASQYYEISILRALKKYFFIYIFVAIFYILLVIISTIVMISYLYLSLS